MQALVRPRDIIDRQPRDHDGDIADAVDRAGHAAFDGNPGDGAHQQHPAGER